MINNGVYRCGFASTQTAYDEAMTILEQRMEELEAYLNGSGPGPFQDPPREGTPLQFLVGHQLTMADVRLFNTLVRMDEAYVCYFKCGRCGLLNNEKKFANILRYTAGLYNGFPGIRDSVFMDDIRQHYYTSYAVTK